MRNILAVSIVMGAIVGLLVGGFYNVFNVPVMEWAIELEGAAAEAAGEVDEGEGIVISLGQQRIGLVAGLAVLGVLFGAIFTGLYHLVRLATPGWNTWAWAVIAAVLGFWAVSLVAQVKYPLNPPGIGEDASLLARQGFQFLFIAISLVLVAVGVVVSKAINQSGAAGIQRLLSYAGLLVAYAVVMVLAFILIPGNPDPIPEWVPESLVIMFRTFALIGHLLLWVGIGLSVAGYLRYRERGIQAMPAESRQSVATR